jgi:hypothetical protein
MHGGSIDVASVVGEGTSFTVHLPRLSEPIAPLAADASRVRGRGIRALGSRVRRISATSERGGGE